LNVQFGFGEDHLLLQRTLRDFLAKEHPADRVRELWQTGTGRSPALWGELAELGVPGLLVPEAHEGMGLDETYAVLLFEEAGRAALAEPLLPTAVGARLLAEQRDAELAERWLPRVARGEAILALGHAVNDFVADAHVADLLLLGRGDALYALERSAVEAIAQPANDPARRIFEVRFSAGAAPLARGEAAAALLEAALGRGALFAAAQQIGVAERLLDLAVEHASQREQFGRPIGSFQAVQHRLADVKIALEYARPLVYRAAHSVARGDARCPLHVSMAKLAADEAALGAARAALQVHGAIGYTWEHDLHLWMRRAWSLAAEWGTEPFHRRRVAEAVLAPEARIGPGTTF
jgi:alkylation response protein AidB-like acyl-CoA dehydrogenase